MRYPPLVILLLCNCATAPKPAPAPPGSRGMRASEHLEAASQQDALARQSVAYPDVRPDGTGRVDEAAFMIPWTRSWDTQADHDRLAQIHRGAAAQLEAEYQEACGSRGAAEVSASPLERYAIGGSPIRDGVILYLSTDAGAPDKLLADMRCHRAWMMLAPSDMDDCPLDLANIHVTAHGDSGEIEVTITVSDPKLVPELQRRTSRELEHAGHAHHAPVD
jgi:hypothetical protein